MSSLPDSKEKHSIETFYFGRSKKYWCYERGIYGDKKCASYSYHELHNNLFGFHNMCDTKYKKSKPIKKYVRNGDYVQICKGCDWFSDPNDVKIKIEDNIDNIEISNDNFKISKDNTLFPIDINGNMFTGKFQYRRRPVIRLKPKNDGNDTDESSEDVYPDNTIDDGMKPLPLRNHEFESGM